jgi:hypothetical protein
MISILGQYNRLGHLGICYYDSHGQFARIIRKDVFSIDFYNFFR